MRISKPPTRSAPPWWLRGDEECPHCHQLYAYEVEVRCPACDGPSCPHCVELVASGIVCVICRDAREETEEAAGGG